MVASTRDRAVIAAGHLIVLTTADGAEIDSDVVKSSTHGRVLNSCLVIISAADDRHESARIVTLTGTNKCAITAGSISSTATDRSTKITCSISRTTCDGRIRSVCSIVVAAGDRVETL